MPSETLQELLDRAAAQFGIEPGYWDNWGNHHVTRTAVKQAILGALEVPSETSEELEKALMERSRKEWACLAPATLVVSESQPHSLPLHIPVESLKDSASLTIYREDGAATVLDLNLQDLPQTGSVEIDNHAVLRKQASLPPDLPLGYHEILVRIGSLTARTRYIVAPDRAWAHPHLANGGHAAGISVSLYGLRSGRNWGCGDFRDLRDLIDWTVDQLGASFVGLNPLHAIHNRRPFNTSPYLPNCVYYQNFLYLDVEGIEDYAVSRHAQRLLLREDIRAEIDALRAAPLVEYERVAALKIKVLKLLFVQFLREWRRHTPRAKEFRAFVAAEGALLEDFATYCALDEYLHRRNPDLWMWTQWPEEYRRPDSLEVREFRRQHWRSVLFYEYIEWQIDRQLGACQEYAHARGLSIGLYHDLALATDRFGADLWAHRPFYASGCRVGAPPDDFAPGGQDWGFPPPRSERHREDGYRLFAESIRKNCRHGGALRVDHVMRFFRLYWIPDGCDASQGTYVRECSEDYIRVLALESVRNQVIVIGEDLGTVEPSVRETLARYGVLSYRLLYFEKNERSEFRSAPEYPAQALVSSTTHDLPTIAGFWLGADMEARRQAGVIDSETYQRQSAGRQVEKQKVLDALFEAGLLGPDLPQAAQDYPELTGDLHNALTGFLAQTPSQLLAINQEDLTKEVAQQNLPGTTSQYPNWGRKMKYSLEQLESDPEALAMTAMFRNWVNASGRSNRQSGVGEKKRAASENRPQETESP